ncbi:LuxR C-terminal-related transcriptional regulator [Microbacterium sp. HD4P20]|uniref:helix-turn-helix transcriptional regulator n=1 Tax=Microbacterium sp. HD4P20 TaxID=2864874 RepID=UPI001C63D500|nr:helix-turn-helix transcriptional regulator [Microbacterium sp. HD4P20]MCP2638278.1 LuxR C-terminal-related transcriptional regulator [Microbacterium sp. HD4P20]
MSGDAGELEAITRDERWDELAALLDDRFFAYLLLQPNELRSALEAVPEQWLRDHPRYLMSRSLARGARHSVGMIDGRDFARFREWVHSQEHPATRDRLGLLTGTLRQHLAVGRTADASDTASQILETIDRATDNDGFHDVLAPVLLRAGTAKLLAGDIASALACFSEARRWARVRSAHPFERVASWYLSLGYAFAGNYARADRELQGATPDLSGRSGEVAVYARALTAVGRLQRQDAASWVAAASELDATSEFSWMRVHLRARNALYWGDRELMVHEVEDHLMTSRRLMRPGSMAGDQLRADLADLYQTLGNLSAAEHVLSAAGISDVHRSILTSRSRLHVLQGKHAQALAQLSEAEEQTGGRVQFSPNWRVVQATAGQYMGEPVDVESLRSVALSLDHTQAFDALIEGSVEVRDEVARRLRSHPSPLPEIYPLAPSASRVVLTPREREVLDALRQHPSIKGLAAALHISPNTAKTHLRALYRKLGASGREHALRIASRGRE